MCIDMIFQFFIYKFHVPNVRKKTKRQIISRVLYTIRRWLFVIYLVPTSQSGSIDLPSKSSEQPLSLGLHGLSVRKVYLANNVTIAAVSSYRSEERRVGK